MTIAVDINDVVRDFTREFILTYEKHVDQNYDINVSDVKDFDLFKLFPFKGRREYERFRYEDFAWDIYQKANPCNANIAASINMWKYDILGDLDEDVNVMLFSPFETDETMVATYTFLAQNKITARELYFPIDSITIYDKADIVITANPRLIENVPEGKKVIKVKTSYNEDVEAEYAFDSLKDIIHDENDTLINIINNHGREEN